MRQNVTTGLQRAQSHFTSERHGRRDARTGFQKRANHGNGRKVAVDDGVATDASTPLLTESICFGVAKNSSFFASPSLSQSKHGMASPVEIRRWRMIHATTVWHFLSLCATRSAAARGHLPALQGVFQQFAECLTGFLVRLRFLAVFLHQYSATPWQ